jgi:hypothetical protein
VVMCAFSPATSSLWWLVAFPFATGAALELPTTAGWEGGALSELNRSC